MSLGERRYRTPQSRLTKLVVKPSPADEIGTVNAEKGLPQKRSQGRPPPPSGRNKGTILPYLTNNYELGMNLTPEPALGNEKDGNEKDGDGSENDRMARPPAIHDGMTLTTKSKKSSFKRGGGGKVQKGKNSGKV